MVSLSSSFSPFLFPRPPPRKFPEVGKTWRSSEGDHIEEGARSVSQTGRVSKVAFQKVTAAAPLARRSRLLPSHSYVGRSSLDFSV